MNATELFTNLCRAPRIVFAKGTIVRQLKAMTLDLEQYAEADYEKIVPNLNEIDQQLRACAQSKDGMRWLYCGDSVYFLGQRVFDFDYEDFVSKVNVAHAAEFYRDSVSVDYKVISRDAFGRPTRQAIRVVALPQPNYAAFFGKGELDVCKLEKIQYAEHEQTLWMLTVDSPNGSAICDDGYFNFKRIEDGRKTLVSFLACQNFPIPPLMKAVGIDKFFWLKRKLTESAYRKFFNTMMDNVMNEYRNFSK